MKQAKTDAAKEIDSYKIQKDKELKEFEQKNAGGVGELEKKAEAEAKAQADREELKAKQEEMLAKREEAYDTLQEATDVLSRMTEEALDKFPELDEQYNVVRDLYSKVQ